MRNMTFIQDFRDNFSYRDILIEVIKEEKQYWAETVRAHLMRPLCHIKEDVYSCKYLQLDLCPIVNPKTINSMEELENYFVE